jgi:hypothetical protein
MRRFACISQLSAWNARDPHHTEARRHLSKQHQLLDLCIRLLVLVLFSCTSGGSSAMQSQHMLRNAHQQWALQLHSTHHTPSSTVCRLLRASLMVLEHAPVHSQRAVMGVRLQAEGAVQKTILQYHSHSELICCYAEYLSPLPDALLL